MQMQPGLEDGTLACKIAVYLKISTDLYYANTVPDQKSGPISLAHPRCRDLRKVQQYGQQKTPSGCWRMHEPIKGSVVIQAIRVTAAAALPVEGKAFM